MTHDHHHHHLITEWESCPVCGKRGIPASDGTTVEMQCYVEFLSHMYLVRAHVDLGQRQHLCVHPFELTAIAKYGESPTFRWRVAARSVTILPYAPIVDFLEAEQLLKTWALRRIELNMEHQYSANLPKPHQIQAAIYEWHFWLQNSATTSDEEKAMNGGSRKEKRE